MCCLFSWCCGRDKSLTIGETTPLLQNTVSPIGSGLTSRLNLVATDSFENRSTNPPQRVSTASIQISKPTTAKSALPDLISPSLSSPMFANTQYGPSSPSIYPTQLIASLNISSTEDILKKELQIHVAHEQDLEKQVKESEEQIKCDREQLERLQKTLIQSKANQDRIENEKIRIAQKNVLLTERLKEIDELGSSTLKTTFSLNEFDSVSDPGKLSLEQDKLRNKLLSDIEKLTQEKRSLTQELRTTKQHDARVTQEVEELQKKLVKEKSDFEMVYEADQDKIIELGLDKERSDKRARKNKRTQAQENQIDEELDKIFAEKNEIILKDQAIEQIEASYVQEKIGHRSDKLIIAQLEKELERQKKAKDVFKESFIKSVTALNETVGGPPPKLFRLKSTPSSSKSLLSIFEGSEEDEVDLEENS